MNIKRTLYKYLGYFLSKIRYLNKNDPFSKFEKLKRVRYFSNGATVDSSEKKTNVLILPIRVCPSSNLLEGLLGYALSIRRCNVSCLLDGGYLDISENNSIPE